MRATSVAARAVLALLLTIGFYGLALGILAALLWVVYAQFRFWDFFNLKLTLVCLVGAGAIFWAILPRWQRFVPPGPLLDPREQPRLFREIEDIARKTGQPMPSEVYLVPDVNAFVAERGGFLGVGSRRIMGVGLPLLPTLTVSQLRAVLAHEFGHYYGGDTKLGLLVYRTTAGVSRTIEGLGAVGSWLKFPFLGYGILFLRITNSVSRSQEFAADRLAARVVGRQPAIDGLRTIHGVADVYSAFAETEVAPVIVAGYRPALVEGFIQFLAAPSVDDAVKGILREQMAERKPDPYDTHPPLPARIAALQALPPTEFPTDDRPAFSLVDDIPDLELRLMIHNIGERRAVTLTTIGWSEVGAKVFVPAWEDTAKKQSDVLQGLTAANLPAYLKSPGRLRHRIASEVRGHIDRALADQLENLPDGAARPTAQEVGEVVAEQSRAGAIHVVGAALASALLRQGWQLECLPGKSVSLRRGDTEIQPFETVVALADGSAAAVESWSRTVQEAGIADLPLGPAAEPVAQQTATGVEAAIQCPGCGRKVDRRQIQCSHCQTPVGYR